MVFETVIQRNVKLSESPSYGKPVILYDASSKGAINHMNLAREILQRNAMTKMSQEKNVIIN
jgi:chromosome partitioning protein